MKLVTPILLLVVALPLTAWGSVVLGPQSSPCSIVLTAQPDQSFVITDFVFNSDSLYQIEGDVSICRSTYTEFTTLSIGNVLPAEPGYSFSPGDIVTVPFEETGSLGENGLVRYVVHYFDAHVVQQAEHADATTTDELSQNNSSSSSDSSNLFEEQTVSGDPSASTDNDHMMHDVLPDSEIDPVMQDIIDRNPQSAPVNPNQRHWLIEIFVDMWNWFLNLW